MGVVVGYFGKHFADDEILAVSPADVRVIAVIRIHLLVHGQRQLEHLRAYRFQVRFGIRQQLFRSNVGFHHQLEFLVVEFFAEAPG